ncbi:hypothetical protein ABL78_5389 [Leptomonas seymouri]|uniref:Uncharacterized protein n=1 Tax=Leptomonas seymouri TaxID=5684 RepID=A0A0N1I3K7_LEPSE|nr:hypothetical protein ABL78_5389 [Leptomonas seymouri]|eukprot:KPI85560.1 hypothetical protein ABL78_5389 [Leptomonas seymouri]
MGCKASAVRTGSSSGLATPEDQRGLSPPSPPKARPTNSSSQASADPKSQASPQGRDGHHGPAVPEQLKPSRSPMPTSPRHFNAEAMNGNSLPRQQQPVTYAQDDDPFAPPPPLPPELDTRSDSLLTVHMGSNSSYDSDDNDQEEVGRLENHFDPIPMPAAVQDSGQKTDNRGRAPPRLLSAEPCTACKGAPGSFRISISDRDKTDSAQAAKEYQQRMEAKRNAEEVHTKRRRLEEFDPVRPADSFNVTHRGLLGRCWDRRAAELIPVSFVHTIAKALLMDKSNSATLATTQAPGWGDELPPGSPIQHPSRLSRRSGLRGGTENGSGTMISPRSRTGFGGRRVPRRSHWFSVGGVSTDGLVPITTSSPTAMEPFYLSSPESSPTVARPVAPTIPLLFPVAMGMGGGLAISDVPIHISLSSSFPAVGESSKPSPKRPSAASSAEVEASVNNALSNLTTMTLTTSQVMALSWEAREKYYNLMITRNPRFMGIKDNFAYKLGSGVSDDRSVKFLRKRNLEPAPGVTAVRWNRVEFFHPSLHTLLRAVAMTQGMSMELSQIEQATSSATESAPTAGHDGNFNALGLYTNGSVNGHEPTLEQSLTGGSGVAAAAEGAGANSLDALRRSFSQFVMGQVENCSFAQADGRGCSGARSQNGSFMNGNGNDKPQERQGLLGGDSFLLDTKRSPAKDAEGGSPSAAMQFPEDSVLSLALSMPYSRLGLLAGVPPAVRNAALNNVGKLSGHLMTPPPVGLGSRKGSRDALNTAGSNALSPSRGSGYTALRASTDSVMVALNVSCFSVSINPFEWQERHYTRYPVDIDGSKRSSRNNYGEGVVTDVMYGGLMVVECSSMEAVKELQALLASMAWTEGRTLHGIVKDVRKHLKTVHNNLHKSRLAAAKRSVDAVPATTGGKPGSEEAATAMDWSVHRYRILRRIGGRPMRDTVELEEISVFFDADKELREARTPLHHPRQSKGSPAAHHDPSGTAAGAAPTGVSSGKNATAPSPGLDKLPTESKPCNPHSSSSGPEPDSTPSFSRVASAWVGLPVISAVLRTWGLHLLACPEYALPTAMFLQKHAALAPVLQLTALGSFYHEGNTPSDEDAATADLDYLFFESDGLDFEKAHHTHGAAAHHPQPAPRIPKYNRFYASFPASPEDDGEHEEEDHHAHAYTRSSSARGDGESGVMGPEGTAAFNPQPGSNSTPTAAPPSRMKASGTTLDEVPNAQQQQQTPTATDGTGYGRLRTRQRAPNCAYGEGNYSNRYLGPKSHSKETLVGEGGEHAADYHHNANAPLFCEQQSTLIMNSSDIDAETASRCKGERAEKEEAELPPPKTPSVVVGSVQPTQITATRPNSPLSSGRVLAPKSRRAGDHQSTPSLSSSSSTSSLFDVPFRQDARHSTIVFQPNNSSLLGSGGATERPAASNSRLEKKTLAQASSDRTSLSSFTTVVFNSAAGAAAKHKALRTTTRTPTDGPSGSSLEASTLVHLSKVNPPQLLAPPPLEQSNAALDKDIFEIVAMARTVGPADSLAAQEARRRANANARTPQPPEAANPPCPQLGRRGSSGSVYTAVASSTDPPPASVKDSACRKVKTKTTAKAKTKKSKKVTVDAEGKASSPSPSSATEEVTKVTIKRHSSATGTPPTKALLGAAQLDAETPLPPAASAPGVCKAEVPQVQPLGTPAGAAGGFHMPDTPSGVSYGSSVLPSVSPPIGGAAAVSAEPQVSEEEAEGLWFMTMLEVKAQRQELEDLRQARRNAEDQRQKRQDELRALNRVLLPLTHPQELDCSLLYLKTALFESDDIPNGRLFLQHPDWLPLLAAVWTSPANRIRSVEIAAELTWVDIPRLGLISGLLYHDNAPGPLEELIIRSEKLLGAPRNLHTAKSGGESTTATSGGGGLLTKARWQKAKGKAKDLLNASNTSLNFATELDRAGCGFGPGCPPFFIAPEEARDTLWLLLCAVAMNTATPNFRIVLKGIQAPEAAGGVGSSGGGSAEPERTASSMLTSFFASRRRDERGGEPLLLKAESMLLDSFVVQPTLRDGDDDGGSSQRNFPHLKAASPPVLVASSGPSAAQNASHNSVSDEADLLVTATGSIRFDSPLPLSMPVNGSAQHSPVVSLQTSAVIIVSDSLGNISSQDPLGGDETALSLSPDRHRRLLLSTHVKGRAIDGLGQGVCSPKVAPAAVPTHQHHVKRRPWVRDGAEVEERPFYEVLLHHCKPIEEACTAAVNSDDPSSVAAPYISHYHHPYNAIHNDARFYVSAERQVRLQKAVQRAVAVANGETLPQDADDSSAVYSSKPSFSDAKHQQQESSEQTRTPTPPHVAYPPPLLFYQTNMVFGLESAEEERKALLYEEQQLRDRAPDIWKALRKSVKHYNQGQQELRQRAMKGGAKNAPLPPPMRLITLEY